MSTTETFPLILFSAIQHPDDKFRCDLKKMLADWIHTFEPNYTLPQIMEVLQNCKGTSLEPFILKPEDMEIAGMLIRLAFSKAYKQTRFRIVSRETLGNDGGCVLTNNLKHFYVERFVLGKRNKTPMDFWSFTPNNLPTKIVENLGATMRDSTKLAKALEARAQIDAHGCKIALSRVNLQLLEWPEGASLSNLLQKYSYIGESQVSLESMGIRVDAGKEDLSLVPGSAESTMRLTAHMLNKSLIVLYPGPQYPGCFKIYIYLELPSEGERTLQTLPSATSKYFRDWLSLELTQHPNLKKAHRFKIAKWLMPHDCWVDKEFLEEL